MELKKPHPSRLVGGAQTWDKLVDVDKAHVDKNLGGVSWEQGVPDPHQTPSPGFQCQQGKSPQLLAAKTNGS